jgi:hypothetical protein
MIVVDNGNLETDVGKKFDFSIKLNNDNVFIHTDDNSVQYDVELLDQNGQIPEWLTESGNKKVLTKVDSIWRLQFAPKVEQKGVIYIRVTRQNVITKQDVEVTFSAHVTPDPGPDPKPDPKNDFVTTPVENPQFVTDQPYSLSVNFDAKNVTVVSDDPNTKYTVRVVNSEGNTFKDDLIIFPVQTFYKKDIPENYNFNIVVQPKRSTDANKFWFVVDRDKGGKIESFKQAKTNSFTTIDPAPDQPDWVNIPTTISLQKGVPSTIKAKLNYKNSVILHDPKGTKYELFILNEKGEVFDSEVLKQLNKDTITKTDDESLDVVEISVISELVTSGNFKLKVVKSDGEWLSPQYYFDVKGDKSDSVTTDETISLDKSIGGTIAVTLNQDSEDVRQDVNGTPYQISILDNNGQPFDKAVLDTKEATLIKGEINKVDIPVSSSTVTAGTNFKLKFVRNGVTTIQKAEHKFIVYDADPVLAHPKEITIPQGSDGVSLSVSLNPDSSAVAQDEDGTTYTISVVDEQGNAFSAETVTANTVTLTKGSKLSDVITLTSNNLSDWKNYKLWIESSSNGKILSRIFYKFNVVVANQAPFDVTKANINTKSDTPVWLGGDKKSFYGYSEYQVEDLQINDLGLVIANLYTTDPITEDAPNPQYIPFIITDQLKKSVANFNTCPVGDELFLDMQAITSFSSSGRVLAYEPICYSVSRESYYNSGLYFYGKNNKYSIVKTIDNRSPTWIHAVSNNGRYIVSNYNGFNNNYGVYDLDKDVVHILKMINEDEITTSKSDVYGVSDDGLIILQNKNDADVVSLISCDSNNGKCKQLQQFSAGFEYAKLSGNGQYLYVVLNNNTTAKKLGNSNKKQRLLVANGSYKVVAIDPDKGTITPIPALSSLTHYPELAVTNTGTLIVNYTSYEDPMIYLLSGKTAKGSVLANKLGITASPLAFINISNNGKYVVFAAVEAKVSGLDPTEFSAISRRYMKDGIDEVIKGM